MYKQIFSKSDGLPMLIETDDFDTEIYTDVQPPNGLYQPIHFDGNEWVGTPYDEWLANQPKEEPSEPDPLQKATANLQMQLMKSNIAQLQLQKQNAQMMLEITKLKGDN
ncbi:hypothetical protein HSZ49_09155 [Staphylococcus saprophyticus]|uniref:hypothetical protein n=1 Tax=Staphylococcus saprophyticus TaxID=29385 RepID=UPI00157CFFDE|nr:hypothetical protein [Staphylococcus saprophyticus]QKQ05987.1 hypothetical protein HSZ49_09155 [Staphylococcus saprophyticus]